MGKVVEKNENDYVNVLEVADKVEIEECVCSRCGISYKRVKGSNQKKTVCKKCFYDNRRKKNEKMQYTVENGIATFITNNGDAFIVDVEDINRVAQYKWYLNGHGYIVGWVNGKSVQLHRFLTGLLDCNSEGLVTDHINHCKTDNRKSNLRICTHQNNSRNRDSKGFNKRSNGKKYKARIGVNGKDIYLGDFATPEQARAVRIIDGEKKYFGEFSSNKHLFDDPEILRLYEEAMESIKYLHKNKYSIDGEVVYITASNCDEEFIIDLEDYEKIKDYTWCYSNGYLITGIDGTTKKLVRILLDLKTGDKKKVKFIDGNNHNYRRDNLQVIECKTKAKNQRIKGGN